MSAFICTTCGTQYQPSQTPPAQCLICDDERQFIPESGQTWTTLNAMRESNVYSNRFTKDEKGIFSIVTHPAFAIGQTAFMVQTGDFNLLWDCITYLDDRTIEEIQTMGGIDAIALSHPHYYSSIAEWAEAFDVPVYLHEDDREWVTRANDHIRFWSGESLTLADGVVLYRLGGHFKGASVVHWEDGHEGKGVLFTGDTIQVVADSRWVSFMYSYPNLIPLPVSTIRQMANKVKDLKFDRLYNAFHRVVKEDASVSVQKSAQRYIHALTGHYANRKR